MVDTIPAILRAAAERYGDKAAYVDGDRVLTFDELLGFVQAAARGYVDLGVKPENLLLCDSQGVIYTGRSSGMNRWKARYAADTEARSQFDARLSTNVLTKRSMPTAKIVRYSSVPAGVSPRLTCTI